MTAQRQPGTACLELSFDWLFTRGKEGRRWITGVDAAPCETVDLPHTWNERDSFQPGIDYYRGWGSYRRTFRPPTLSAADDEQAVWLLESGGFYGIGDVWMNGRKVADIDGEYMGFRLDVSRHLIVNGDNTVAVRLTNRCPRYVLPGISTPDFILYGGLSGMVRLLRLPSLHIEHGSIVIRCANPLDTRPVLSLSCAVRNASGRTRNAGVRWTVRAPDGSEVSMRETTEVAIGPGAVVATAEAAVPVCSPVLWSVEHPALYRVECVVTAGGESAGDSVSEAFGIRSAEFRGRDGFFLNGARLELRGCNRHESMPGFGQALPVTQHREDALLLKEAGFNLVRLSHYPQHPAFLDACDELGLLVLAEIATWKSVRRGRWLRRALRQMERMVRRDRNRPGVVLWGMGNESRSRGAYAALKMLVGSLDPTRPVTYAENHLYRALRARTAGLPDVWGCNYELDAIEEGRRRSVLGAVLVTECSNVPTALRGDAGCELEQVSAIERDVDLIAASGCSSGYVVWCMNDYATMRKDRYLRWSGIVDAWRLPKMACALLRARHAQRPFIRMFGAWGGAADGVEREVHIFSNCDEVALQLGSDIVFRGRGTHVAARVKFARAELVAIGSLGGESVRHCLLPHGEVAGVSVRPSRSRVAAQARDTIPVDLFVVDHDGRQCTGWAGEVRVEVRGGGARSRVFSVSGLVPVGWGQGRTFITGTGRPGTAVIEAHCGYLAAGRAEVVFF